MPKNPAAIVNDWNEHFGVGQPVRFWTGLRRGPGRFGRTRSYAHLLANNLPVVWIRGVSGCVSLSHVEHIAESDLLGVEVVGNA